jgi:flagellar basal-body rod protein FlgB
MFERIEMMRMARAMGHHVAQRQVVVARNIANADTPGYRAQDLAPFEDSYRRGVETPALRASNPRHIPYEGQLRPTALTTDEAQASPNGNTVSLETEMVRAAEVKRQHDLSIGIYRSALTLMRASLGRR